MVERHTGTNIPSRIQEVLEVWNVQVSHVNAVVTDNASDMTANLEYGHLPCFAHTLRLAVNKGPDANSFNQSSCLARKLVGHLNTVPQLQQH